MPQPISRAASGARTMAERLLWTLGASILLVYVVARVVGGLPRTRRPRLRLGPESTVHGPSRSLPGQCGRRS